MSAKNALRTLPLVLALLLSLVGVANATPPGIPTAATARSELASLTVAADGTMTGYSRDLFPHWHIVSGTCDTRETVLKRDGTNVVTSASCSATSGTWLSPYDGATWHAASDVDIDHVVPLANAWRTGARSWTTAKREQFANDLSSPQLIAVTDNVNQAKGDKSPDVWKPPLTSYWCTYARMWVASKYKWALTVNSAEKSALTSMLGRC
ncbi:HNH endonuclease family protein [Actinocrispum wychmicini]|uniref:Uncharacterized protein DUF1524 n=1 Tax=Actinocrispum wychmicini TaxID=1213861 RepID=A0A4R2JWJ2_9PSEU|nr:HNH endonuclease family protein [Actinocrispum wychmicini]TCO64871.1 uncharacterized protein DUF1524 [Actinocrispum wychmicini]